MNRVEVTILHGNIDGTPKFLAQLTQRGHLINDIDDVWNLYSNTVSTIPSEYLLKLPHTTIQRMNYLTVAISGLSTKAVSQLRTHAKRLTFISTSTQYSDFSGCEDNYVVPYGLTVEQIDAFKKFYQDAQTAYEQLQAMGVDKDRASYLLPQGLRKVLIVSGNLDDWNYVMRTRLCHRNTDEVQRIMRYILDEVERVFGKEYCVNMLPPCVNGKCLEGKFSCGKKFKR
jgi:thymidylate synthase (FAD)